MAGMVLPERPEDQPPVVIEAMMRLTGLDEQYVREHLAIMSSADAVDAWERIRAHEEATGEPASRPEHLPEAVVSEIGGFSGVEEGVIRAYLAGRRAFDAISGWEQFRPASAAEARLRRWQVRLAYGRPLPPWAEELLDQLGVEEDQHDLARELVAAAIALVGGGEAEIRTWLAKVDPGSLRTPLEVLEEGGWEEFDTLLVGAFAREAGV